MKQIERIQAMLYGKGIHAELRNDDSELVAFVSTGPMGSRLVVAERSFLLRCSILIPITCPDYRRPEMAMAIARANWNLNGGSFRLDCTDGELRYETCFPLLDSEPTDDQLEWVVFASWHTTERYSMALAEVALSLVAPDLAIARAEASGQESGERAN